MAETGSEEPMTRSPKTPLPYVGTTTGYGHGATAASSPSPPSSGLRGLFLVSYANLVI